MKMEETVAAKGGREGNAETEKAVGGFQEKNETENKGNKMNIQYGRTFAF